MPIHSIAAVEAQKTFTRWGALVDFVALILGLVLYYIRPQEWLLAIQPLKPVSLVMALAVIGVISKTGLSWRQIFKTPHDWLVLAYCVWMVVTSPDKKETFDYVYPLLLFYIVAVQALTNVQRMTRFLAIWAAMIFVIAGLGLLSPYGIDPTGADYMTNHFKGRLALGSSIFNNPNSFGHSVVPVILMIYFLGIWRRPIFMRIGTLPLFAVPLYCIYLTLSKGAFISGFATAVAALTFGRPKIVQIGLLAFAMTSGWAAMQTLPRMNEINKSKTDEAIQGRVHAFTYGLETLQRSYTGFGRGDFVKNIMRDTGIGKASHSSYVQIGAELGKVGFVLFLAILYCCLKTLFTSKTRDDSEERVRRILFTMLISYMISSWMVDFAYRVAFFLCVGAIAAYHRLLQQSEVVTEEKEEKEREAEEFVPLPAMTLSGVGQVPVIATPTVSQTALDKPVAGISRRRISRFDEEPEPEEPSGVPGAGIQWNRFRWWDYVLIGVMYWATVKVWAYAVATM